MKNTTLRDKLVEAQISAPVEPDEQPFKRYIPNPRRRRISISSVAEFKPSELKIEPKETPSDLLLQANAEPAHEVDLSVEEKPVQRSPIREIPKPELPTFTTNVILTAHRTLETRLRDRRTLLATELESCRSREQKLEQELAGIRDTILARMADVEECDASLKFLQDSKEKLTIINRMLPEKLDDKAGAELSVKEVRDYVMTLPHDHDFTSEDVASHFEATHGNVKQKVIQRINYLTHCTDSPIESVARGIYRRSTQN